MTTIAKTITDWKVPPNLTDYEHTRAAFRWSSVPDLCEGMGPSGCNIAYAAVDRHADGPVGSRTALRFVSSQVLDGTVATHDLSYAELARLSQRFTNVLRSLGINKGDRVFTLLGRCPELYVSIFGALRNGSVVSPLFSAFGPEPIATRLSIGEADVLVTTKAIYRKKLAKIRHTLPVQYILLIDDSPDGDFTPDTMNLWHWMDAASETAPIEHTTAGDPALLHFTSGTTGTPKGALHVHGAVSMHYVTGLYALDLHRDDMYWCTADPGWVTGMSYGVISPLVHGVTSIVDEGEFDAERWYRILQSQAVSVWYTAPTAIRMLIKVGDSLLSRFEFPRLRFIASVGEPLNAEAVWWGKRMFGLPIHDNWWQTETGGIMIANTPAFDIKPGSMGRPLPGVEAYVVTRSEDGAVSVIEEPDVEGELALKPGWPSMFREYLNQEERYRKCFADGLYLTGDLVKRDRDGYFWFVGRADDVIKSAGHLIGPFEVENALTDHPAVAEVAVIGKPDPTVGEVVKAFVTLKDGFSPTEELRLELMGQARKRLGAAVAPKEIEFVESLPHTRSGKIMRRLLKARELGLPEGDTSSVEAPAPQTQEASP
jgi:acetyl-CoA synthetase